MAVAAEVRLCDTMENASRASRGAILAAVDRARPRGCGQRRRAFVGQLAQQSDLHLIATAGSIDLAYVRALGADIIGRPILVSVVSLVPEGHKNVWRSSGVFRCRWTTGRLNKIAELSTRENLLRRLGPCFRWKKPAWLTRCLTGAPHKRCTSSSLTVEVPSIRLLVISGEWGTQGGDESGSASDNRRHTHSRHVPLSYRQPLVVAASCSRFVVSPDGQSAVRKWQAAASRERAG